MTKTENSRADAGTKRPRHVKGSGSGSNKPHMPKGRGQPTKTSHHHTKNKSKKHPKPSQSRTRGRGAAPTTIVFDAAARAKYLLGFSQRKQERRAYGLAMQKIKDRQARLERRAELKLARQEQIQEAEERKQNMWRDQIIMTTTTGGLKADGSEKNDKNDNSNNPEDDELDEIQTFQDEETQQQWGGTVIVTTSTHIPGAEEDPSKDDMNEQRNKKQRGAAATGHRTHDAEQAYAGNVERFLKQLKGHLPSKRKKAHQAGRDAKRRGGQHGASQMKGVGSGADLKMAQKVLSRATKQSKGKDRGGGRKRKR